MVDVVVFRAWRFMSESDSWAFEPVTPVGDRPAGSFIAGFADSVESLTERIRKHLGGVAFRVNVEE